MIHFQLLGEIGLRGPDGSPLDQLLRQPKRLALLAYLATPTPGTWHRRDTLLGLFWPGLDTAHARTSLRNALYMVRQVVGEPALQTRGDEEVSVNPAVVETDLASVSAALSDGRHGDALKAYVGDLLPGLYPPDSEGFQRWLDEERERLRGRVAEAGKRHAAELERVGRLEDCRATLRRVLEIHADDETAVRALMSLSHAMGDLAGALGAYEAYRLRLAREYEVEPAPETVALASSIRRGSNSSKAEAQGDFGAAAGHPAALTIEPTARTDERAQTRVTGPLPARPRVWAAAIGIVAILGLAAVAWNGLRATPQSVIGRSLPVTSGDGLQIEPAISPNGRLVAFTAGSPSRSRIYVTRLEGGTPWAMSNDSNSVELLPRWSPDNDALAYLSGSNAYVAAAVGGTPRLIAAGGPGEAAIRSASWSPRGDSIVVVRHDSLLVVPLDGPGFRFVGIGTQIHSCVWSPDGRWIACVSGNWVSLIPGTLFGNQAPCGILIFPAGGGAPVPLTDREHSHFSPTWSADGQSLWFLSDRDGVWGEAYAVRVSRSGQGVGPFQRVGLQAESISLARDRIAYSRYSRRSNIWSVPIPDTGVASMADVVRVTTGNQIVEVVRASRDGQWLVYDSNVRGNADIYRVPTTGGRPERLTDDPRDEYAADLSPGNDEVAYHLWSGGTRLLHIRDLSTGRAGEAVAGETEMGVPRWSPDGGAIAAWDHRTEPGAVVVIQRRSDGGWAPPTWRLDDAQLPIWSPDGTRLAFLRVSGAIDAIPADSGPLTRLYAPRPATNDPIATFLAWDGGRPDLYFLGHDTTGSGGIWALPLRRGVPRLLVDLRDPEGRTNGPTLASDGTGFYFTLEERVGNIQWAEVLQP